MFPMMREHTAASTAGVLCAVAFLAAVGVGGYVLGRDVIGEHYLKPQASPVTVPGSVGEPTPAETVPPTPPLLGSDPFAFLSKGKRVSKKPADRERPASSAEAGEEAARSAEAQGPRRYTIQVGIYLDEENSRLLQEDLRNRGYLSRVTKEQDSGRTVHRVQMGPYSSEEAAQRMADELRAQGYRVNVIPQG